MASSLTREVDEVSFILNAYHCCLDSISRSLLLLFLDNRPSRSDTAHYRRQKHAYFQTLVLKLGFDFHPINLFFSDGLQTLSFDLMIEDTLPRLSRSHHARTLRLLLNVTAVLHWRAGVSYPRSVFILGAVNLTIRSCLLSQNAISLRFHRDFHCWQATKTKIESFR